MISKKQISKTLVLAAAPLLILSSLASCSPDDDERSIEFGQPSYGTLINLLSSNLFDCENPNYGRVSLPLGDNEYELTGKEVYQLVSQFNCLDFYDSRVIVEYADEEFLCKINESIDVLVSYKYLISENNDDDAIVHFYVCQDGEVVLKDSPSLWYFCTEEGTINYDNFEKDIQRIVGNN